MIAEFRKGCSQLQGKGGRLLELNRFAGSRISAAVVRVGLRRIHLGKLCYWDYSPHLKGLEKAARLTVPVL